MRHSETSVPNSFSNMLLPNKVSREHPAGHDRYYDNEIRTTGRIEGIIEALSPIHIGSGIIDPAQDSEQQDIEIVRKIVRTGEIAVIPGASLKGAVRSVVEAISESCVCKTKRNILNILSQLPGNFIECRRRQREKASLCIACRMFGAMGFQGNVRIQDAPQIDGQIVTKSVPELYSPEYYETDKEGFPLRKFYEHGAVASGDTPIEACEVGSKFRFIVRGDNLTQAEWGLLFIALGHHSSHPFKLKIGGAKPVGFGSVNCQIEKIYVDEKIRDRYLAWDSEQEAAKTGTELEDWKTECMNQASDSLIVPGFLEELAQILQYPRQTPQQSPTQTLQPQPAQPQPAKEPKKPKVKIGDRVNATILKKDEFEVTVRLQTDESKEIVFEYPYFPGKVEDQVRLKVTQVDGEGKIKKVGP